MSVFRTPFQLRTSTGDIIRGDCYIDATTQRSPMVVMVHGYTGFKNWGSLPAQCEWFAERGMAVMAFNFSHNGIGPDSTQITEMEMFAANTISRELEELELVLSLAHAGRLPNAGQCDADAMVLLGHSRGGAEAIIAARETECVRAVASWGGIGNFDRWTDRQKAAWRAEGKRTMDRSRSNVNLEMSAAFLDDLEANATRFSIGWNVATLRKPLLLVHGAQDVTVPPSEAEQLFDASDKGISELVIIPATGHTFGAAHPFTGMNSALRMALETTHAFFRKALATA